MSRRPGPGACYMVAFDHRGSFERSLRRLGVDSGPARRAGLKLTIWRGVSRALGGVPVGGSVPAGGVPAGGGVPVGGVPVGGSAAILVDRGHGRIAAEAADAGVAVAVALEASGQRILRAEAPPPALTADLRTLRASFGKVLVRWHPRDPASGKRRQIAALRELDEAVRAAGARLLLELLVPPDPLDPAAGDGGGGPRPDWEQAVLPRLQHAAVGEILASGVAPALWKIQGHPDTGAAAASPEVAPHPAFGALADLVGSARPDASILVLGGGSEIAGLRRLFSCRAGSERFNGFAVGRSIWWDPVAALCRGDVTESEACRAVGERFLAVIDAFESATRVPARPC